MTRLFAALLVSVLLASCRTTAPDRAPPAEIALYVESGRGDRREYVLPQSGVTVTCGTTPVVTNGGVAHAGVAQLELGKALLLELTKAGLERLQGELAATQAARVVVVVNGSPIGVFRTDPAPSVASLVVFVELSEDELSDVVETLKPALGRRRNL